MNSVLDQDQRAVIKVAEEFSRTPGGRFYTDGPASGEQFREELLIPLLKNGRDVVVVLDGARGYPSSFLEEAFGGLVRERVLTNGGATKEKILTKDDFFKRLQFVAADDFSIYVEDIRSHVMRASDARRA